MIGDCYDEFLSLEGQLVTGCNCDFGEVGIQQGKDGCGTGDQRKGRRPVLVSDYQTVRRLRVEVESPPIVAEMVSRDG